MKELYIIWGAIICMMLAHANATGNYLLSFSGDGNGGYYLRSNTFGRGWDFGSGSGGFHK